MTPLAMELLEDLYSYFYFRPVKPIRFDDQKEDTEFVTQWLRQIMQVAKFFECSSVWPLATNLANDMMQHFNDTDRVDQRLAFLPAHVTWIEVEQPSMKHLDEQIRRGHLPAKTTDLMKADHSFRTAFICVGKAETTTDVARVWHIGYETPREENKPRVWRMDGLTNNLPLVLSGRKPERVMRATYVDGTSEEFDTPRATATDFTIYGYLALINSPRIIGAHTHFPHERVEREKLKKHKLVGKFPLRAWTEILLKVALRPEDRSDDPSQEAHLTGERCMHYCRTYLRVRMGRLEYVEGHWRGNPALGMKRSRYRLEGPDAD